MDAGVTSSGSLHNLSLGAFNEYGENDRYALTLYNLEMVVEPYRETIIRVKASTAPVSSTTQYRWLMVRTNVEGVPVAPAEVAVNSTGSDAHIALELTTVNAMYNLVVQQFEMEGGKEMVVAEGKSTVSCKYVRREFRTLSEEDREDYLSAMEIFFTVQPAEGKSKYGESFNNYARIAAYHSSLVCDL